MAFKTFSEKFLLILKHFSNALNPGLYSFKKNQFSLINFSIFAKILDLTLNSEKNTTNENTLLQIKFYTVKKNYSKTDQQGAEKKVNFWPGKTPFLLLKRKNKIVEKPSNFIL